MELTKEQAQYILNGEKSYRGLILRGKVLDWYYETERLLRGKEKTSPRSCSCEYKAMIKAIHSLISQHRGYLEELVNENTK